jgi:HTH-type transcriptional regulator/antitoxin HipB
MDYPVRTPTQLGQLLKALRTERKLTQADVAARMGLLQSKISALEANPGRTSVERMFRLLSVLGVELVLRQRGAAKQRRSPGEPQW